MFTAIISSPLIKRGRLFADKSSVGLLRFVSSNTFLYLIFVWFLIQALYMALSTKFGIPPDEGYHYDYIRLFTENGWLPFLSDQDGYYHLGEAVQNPFFLYHYLLSIPYHFIQNFSFDVYVLRFINVALGFSSLYITYRIAKQIKLSALARNLSLFMLANTIMFVFLSASINYDNLFIPLSLLTILLTLKIGKNFTLTGLMLLIIVIISGSLVKLSYLPIAVASIAVVCLTYRKSLWQVFKNSFNNPPLRLLFGLAVLAGLLMMIFFSRYVYNSVKYGDFAPSCTTVLTVNECRQNPIYARGEAFDAAPRPPASKSNAQYVFGWVQLMQDRTYGIFAHKKTESTRFIETGALILLLLGIVAVIRKIKRKDYDFIIILGISLFYLLVLINENNSAYQNRGIIEIAVQGRYAFAVLPVFYLVSSHYILEYIKRPILRAVFALSVVAVFATASLPSYVMKTGPDWHTDHTVRLNGETKDFLTNLPLIN